MTPERDPDTLFTPDEVDRAFLEWTNEEYERETKESAYFLRIENSPEGTKRYWQCVEGRKIIGLIILEDDIFTSECWLGDGEHWLPAGYAYSLEGALDNIHTLRYTEIIRPIRR